MHEKEFAAALQKMRDASRGRKFTQTVEFMVNLRGLDMKKPDNRVDVSVVLPHEAGKRAEAKALVFVKDKNFAAELKGKHEFMMEDEIPRLKGKAIGELLAKYNAFFAEGPVMLTVGRYLGQELAPKNRMPKPVEAKLGAVESALAGVSTGMKVSNNKGKFMPVVQCAIGSEKNSDKELAENAIAVYGAVVKALDQGEHSIKSAFVKLTMGPAIRVGKAEDGQKKQ